ncbi:TetR/AcrR family transcriptional regulator [Puniceicoccaceae bacterium K14]|nr:TetR/AcrR family transcriptional regulator [Puniceicoccaceae bacterium K14]
MRIKNTDKKTLLIDTAYQLFEEHGFHATGVDTVVKHAGTTKRTLYRLFGSKENLALEVVRRHDENFRRDLHQKIELPNTDAKQRLLALFDYYGNWFASEDFHGCLFIKTLVEFETSSPILRNAARESKELLRSFIEKLCNKAGAKDPSHLSEQIQILLEGSIITAQSKRNAKSAKIAREMAHLLIEQST